MFFLLCVTLVSFKMTAYASCISSLSPIFILFLTLMQFSLVGQLHLLSSTVTMLAVPSPSLTATLAREFASTYNLYDIFLL